MFALVNLLRQSKRGVFQILRNKSISYTTYKTFRMNLRIAYIFNYEFKSFHTSPYLNKRRKTAEEKKLNNMIEYSPKSKAPLVEVWQNITPRELSEVLKKDMNYISQLFLNNLKDYDQPIEDMKFLKQLLKRSGHRMEVVGRPKNDIEELEDRDIYPRPPAEKSALKPRPPVVTIMGHVDHGKTTLLDALRHSSIVDKEYGGITQHIGAFSVLLDSGARVTFLDTPGHAAFSAMRARGANVTDIVVLVVAADDGVMEQTVESVKMARKAGVPILIAINKIDSPKADVERTKRMLLEVGLQVEDMGGDIQTVSISALKRQNLDLLVEALVLQAELLEIKADYKGEVEGVVIESRVDRHRGKLCTLVVKRGTLEKGAILVAGTAFAKVRTMKDAEGRIMKEVTPGYCAEIEGWREIPSAGEVILEVETERKAKEVIHVREQKAAFKKGQEDKVVILKKAEDLRKEYEERLQLKRKLGRFRLRPTGPRKPEYEDDGKISLNLVIKGDVDGSVEAILDTLETYDSDLCEMDLVHFAVGAVTENDVDLAESTKAVIYTFNVDCPEKVKELAENKGVTIKNFNVIYKLIDDVKDELNARIPPVEVEEICGEADVLQQFEINQGKRKIPTAGCKCVKGVLKKSGIYKLVRNDEVIFTGPLSSLRHLKNEVDTIKTNTECGLQLADKTITFQAGDTVQCIEKVLKPREVEWNPGF